MSLVCHKALSTCDAMHLHLSRETGGRCIGQGHLLYSSTHEGGRVRSTAILSQSQLKQLVEMGSALPAPI